MVSEYAVAIFLLALGVITFMAAWRGGIWGILMAQCGVAVVVFVGDFCILANDPETDLDIIFAIFFPVRALILAIVDNTLLLPVALVGYYFHRRGKIISAALSEH